MAGLFMLRVFDTNLLRENRRRNILFSYFVLMADLGYEPGLLRLISQHTTYYTTAISDANVLPIVFISLLEPKQ